MDSDRVAAESEVSGNQTTIPARIRRELGIDDGDQIRWYLDDDGNVRIQALRRQTGPSPISRATRARTPRT